MVVLRQFTAQIFGWAATFPLTMINSDHPPIEPVPRANKLGGGNRASKDAKTIKRKHHHLSHTSAPESRESEMAPGVQNSKGSKAHPSCYTRITVITQDLEL